MHDHRQFTSQGDAGFLVACAPAIAPRPILEGVGLVHNSEEAVRRFVKQAAQQTVTFLGDASRIVQRPQAQIITADCGDQFDFPPKRLAMCREK